MEIIASLCLGIITGSIITYFALQKMQQTKIIKEYEAQIQRLKEEHQNDIKKVRNRSLDGSRAVIKGKIAEQIAPILPEFKYLPSDARFLGDPIDYIVFNGYTNIKDNSGNGQDLEVVIIDIKTGSATLSKSQQAIANAVHSGRVRFEVVRPGVYEKNHHKLDQHPVKRDITQKAYSVQNIRERHPHAYKPWTNLEDQKLIECHQKGMNIYELAEEFKRKPGGIRSRLKKLGLLP